MCIKCRLDWNLEPDKMRYVVNLNGDKLILTTYDAYSNKVSFVNVV